MTSWTAAGPLVKAAALTEHRAMYYDASWRMIHEEVTDAYSVALGPKPIRAEQQVWGLRYIDDAVMRRRAGVKGFGFGSLLWAPSLDGSPGGAGSPANPTLLSHLWQLSDVQFSVVAVLDQGGQVRERVEYSPYGRCEPRLPAATFKPAKRGLSRPLPCFSNAHPPTPAV